MMDLVVSANYLHLFAFNQCFAKADISGDVCFLFRKLYQVSVNAKVRAVRSESKTVLVDAHATRGKNVFCGMQRLQMWNRIEGLTGEEVCSPQEKGNSCAISQLQK